MPLPLARRRLTSHAVVGRAVSLVEKRLQGRRLRPGPEPGAQHCGSDEEEAEQLHVAEWCLEALRFLAENSLGAGQEGRKGGLAWPFYSK